MTETHQITTEHIHIPVEEESGASAMGAYLAYPQDLENAPGVIVGFELFGLTAYVRTLVDRLAQLGYVALAPDFYHRSSPGVELEATAEGRARGFELLHQLTRQQALHDVQAAITYLRTKKKCTRVGIMGLSVGGHIAYLAATQLDLQATVAFYPGWLPTQDIPLSRPTPTLALTPGIAERNGYLLLLVGEQDPLIPAEQRDLIARELRESGVRHELVVYPDTSHRFFYEAGESFCQEVAVDAWRRVREVLATELASHGGRGYLIETPGVNERRPPKRLTQEKQAAHEVRARHTLLSF
ncbi:dienelactone hydrolase family protein [Thermosporothrix hazakensis]|jgi:carboxymethylenebutenolidase|nr:dienelactone hydrolase family protein [Thermosporothrix hazakensis]